MSTRPDQQHETQAARSAPPSWTSGNIVWDDVWKAAAVVGAGAMVVGGVVLGHDVIEHIMEHNTEVRIANLAQQYVNVAGHTSTGGEIVEQMIKDHGLSERADDIMADGQIPPVDSPHLERYYLPTYAAYLKAEDYTTLVKPEYRDQLASTMQRLVDGNIPAERQGWLPFFKWLRD